MQSFNAMIYSLEKLIEALKAGKIKRLVIHFRSTCKKFRQLF